MKKYIAEQFELNLTEPYATMRDNAILFPVIDKPHDSKDTFLYETMIKFKVFFSIYPEITIRLWLEGIKENENKYHDTTLDFIRKKYHQNKEFPKQLDIANFLIKKFDNINAIEVLDNKDFGNLVYRNWP